MKGTGAQSTPLGQRSPGLLLFLAKTDRKTNRLSGLRIFGAGLQYRVLQVT